jgi:hypothetical protein
LIIKEILSAHFFCKASESPWQRGWGDFSKSDPQSYPQIMWTKTSFGRSAGLAALGGSG